MLNLQTFKNISIRIYKAPLLKSTAIYTIGDSLSKAIPFILLPIVTRYLNPSDFGILTNFGVISQILIAICALNTYSALTVSYFKLDNSTLSSYLSNLVYLISSLALFSFIVIFLFNNIIYKYLGLTILWQILALITAFSTAIFSLYTSLLRMQNKIYSFSGLQIFQSLISALLAIFFVVVLKWNWQGRVFSITAAALITLTLMLWSMKKNNYLFKSIKIKEIKDSFIFGLPLLPHTLSFWLKSGVDKIIITNYIGLSANGIYSLAITLGSVIGIFTSSFFNAYSPIMFKDLNDIDNVTEKDAYLIKKKLVKITYLFAALLSLVCILSYFMMKFIIPLLFKGEYLNTIQFLPFLMISIFFDGMYAIISGYIFYRKKTKILGAITFLSSILQILTSLILVKTVGVMGAVYSNCLISLITFLAVFTYTKKLYPLPWGLNLQSIKKIY